MDVRNNKILIDSNITIYSAEPEMEFLRQWLQNREIHVSNISRIEVLGYTKLTEEDKDYFIAFFAKCQLLKINEDIIPGAIELRQQKSMSIGDAIIAATALSESLSLLTANVKDFKHIKRLDLIGLEDVKQQLR